jgi:DNA-binding LytR/AlgR family response regulator
MTDVENAIESSFVCGICDDDEVVHETVENYLKEYAQSKSIQISVISYYSSDELLEKKDYLNMLFLDIEMPGKDGIELGHILKEKGVDYKIVMLSGMVDRYKEAFKINAFRFVSKPISKKELFLAIDDVMELMEGTETLIAYKDGNSYSIMQKDIVYIEAVSSGIIACVGNTEFTIYKPLSELMDELNGKQFFRSHRSYIVNIHKIQEILKNQILMINGQKALLSRRERKALVQAYVEYDIKRR